MPYIKPREAPYAKLRRLLKGYDLGGPTELSAALGCCYNTARDRLRDPGTFRLDELSAICRRGHVPLEELRECITL